MNSQFKQISGENRLELKAKFHDVTTKKDFFELLFRAIECLPISNAQINRYKKRLRDFRIVDSRDSYTTFTVRKSSGKDRIINAPNGPLKLFHRLVNLVLSCVYEAHPNAFGFRKDGSIVQNASLHVSQHYVYNIDLCDFFSSVNEEMVVTALTRTPFNLKNGKAFLAKEIAGWCTMKVDKSQAEKTADGLKVARVLPQGAPTSPLLSNAVCQSMDVKLTELAKRFGITYSRYADDITFSSNRMLFGEHSSFIQELERIITEQNFSININKTRLQHMSQRQEVTGLVVNQKINVEKKFVKAIRMYLYYWETYGYARAQDAYFRDNGMDYFFQDPRSLWMALDGRLNFLRMVKGKDDSTYHNLDVRFKKLSAKLELRKPIKNSLISGSTFEEHRPADVATFLRLFQDSDGLKYLTHDYDIPGTEFQYHKIMEIAGKDFNKAYARYSVTKSLYARVKHFAFEKRPKWWRWQKGKKVDINIGWGSEEIREWSESNPGVHPIRLKAFRDQFIRPFKDSIQFRAPMFLSAIEETLEEKFAEERKVFDIELVNLESADFFTDVDIFLGGIRHVLDGILERIELSKKIRIEFKRVSKNGTSMKIVEITHLGSLCHREAVVGELMNGNFREAFKSFRGLCNWSVSAKFTNGHFLVHMLNDKVGEPEIEAIDANHVLGFKHILSFY